MRVLWNGNGSIGVCGMGVLENANGKCCVWNGSIGCGLGMGIWIWGFQQEYYECYSLPPSLLPSFPPSISPSLPSTLLSFFSPPPSSLLLSLSLHRVPGGELIERIIADNCLTEAVVVQYLSQLISALQSLHSLSIAHLDVKPENILVSGVEENPIIKLIDFGSAQDLSNPDEVSTVTSSSHEFSAPEVVAQEVPVLGSDMWSVGVLTYTL